MKYRDLPWDHDEEAHKEFISQLAPVVLFAYNRLVHTQKTIEALKENIYAKATELFIYSDAAKNDEARSAVHALREYLHTIKGFRAVNVIEQEENQGLAKSIITGVTEIVNRYSKVIVLEDDIVTSRYFLKYMNDALKLYEKDPAVMEISGYMPEIERAGLGETAFLQFADCWGWGTWQDAWSCFERDPEKLIASCTGEDIKKINFDGSTDLWQQVVDNKERRLHTWAIFWHVAVVLRNGLMLVPTQSLTQNIGMDATGEHCGIETAYNTRLYDRAISKFPVEVLEDPQTREALKTFFYGIRPSLWRRMLRRLWRSIKE
ncbi:MAG: glycosyltransferase family A protein [Selenomonas artemidis]|jgi:sugar transferase